ncbi:sigma-54 interaction domain-containing protein [Sinanaerobacter chloroacetimidivorans]|uniref:Sigma 54-interacting transcriptional regulator n=1 Tax=Sinanaerobacter chloroacetimidivorans TaxID=2818044 RepID=A0A8J7W322_9FIRM|nr:sigma 54-interacting transcriptional regulator [Sinanaerobacter chloroacetimidivorans]MBR0599972.1 sigma 54-interacting transcriptional regulator [Sinanaerobacter chloroacetimidivorans]
MIDINEDFKLILDNIDGFLVIDAEEKIVFMADSLVKQIGYRDLSEVIGKSIRNVIPTNNTYKILQSKKKQIGEVYFVEGYTIVSNGFPLFKNGEFIGAFEYDVFENAGFLHGFLDKVQELSNELNYYKKELRSIRGAKYSIENIIGNSTSTNKLKFEISEASKTNSTVLIQGETGCGKELVAHSIHKASTRSLRNFVKINCAAIPSELFESEIFGYEDGSFTGAKKGGKRGKAELANGGTLFLDEINQLPYHLQAKLLRLIQEKEVTRVGGDFSTPIDLRIIAATNQPLKKLVEENRFREDLYYRLNVFEIILDPLRQRKEDIPLLSSHILGELNHTLGRASHKVMGIDKEVIDYFYSYDWPGNVRELHNVLERAMNKCYDEIIKMEHIQDFIAAHAEAPVLETKPFYRKTLDQIKSEAEREAIINTLKYCSGNRTEAARVLGISRQMLHQKLNTLEIT